jgi:hypothetical protein
VRGLLGAGASAALLIAMMFLGGLFLWVGVPLLWLYVGSQVQLHSESLGLALLVMMVGAVASIVAMIPVLGWLSRKHEHLQQSRGVQGTTGPVALEMVMVASATIAIVGFAIWFFLFAGTSPVPLNLSY